MDSYKRLQTLESATVCIATDTNCSSISSSTDAGKKIYFIYHSHIVHSYRMFVYS